MSYSQNGIKMITVCLRFYVNNRIYIFSKNLNMSFVVTFILSALNIFSLLSYCPLFGNNLTNNLMKDLGKNDKFYVRFFRVKYF